MSINHATILGGGPAGIAAGYYLQKQGVVNVVYEAADSLGGNCKTKAFENFRYDFGAHRLHNVYQEITDDLRRLLGDDLQMINVPSHVYFNNKWAKFPLTPGGLLKVLGPAHVAKAIGQVVMKLPRHKNNFRDDAINKYGKVVAERFLLNYSEKLWGLPTHRLSPAISGKRLKGLTVKSVIKDVLLQKQSEHLDGAFYYPKYGFGQLMEAVGSQLKEVHTKCPVTAINHDGAAITSIIVNGRDEIKDSFWVNTLPVTMFLKMLSPSPPKEVMQVVESIRFRHVRLVVLMLDKAEISRSASLYFPSEEIAFTRIYEPKQRSKAMAPKEQTCVVVEYPFFDGDHIAMKEVKALKDYTIKTMVEMGLIKENEVLYALEEKLMYAYPVLEVDGPDKIAVLENYLSRFKNLTSIGRTASFEYTHFHDIMFEAKKMSELITQI